MNDEVTEKVFSVEAFDVNRRLHFVRGRQQHYHFVVRPSIALVIPVLSNGEIVMIKGYRASMDQQILEFPAGRLDHGEMPRDAAAREVLEEAGFEAYLLDRVGTFATAPHFTNETVYAYSAHGSIGQPQRLTAREEIEVVRIPRARVLDEILKANPTDGKSLAAWLLYVANDRECQI